MSLSIFTLGAFDDLPSVLAALQGVWGVWNNTDGFTVGEMKEIYAGMRIFELAKQVKTVRHYVWSNLDYSFKVRAPVHYTLSTRPYDRESRRVAGTPRTESSTTTARDASPNG